MRKFAIVAFAFVLSTSLLAGCRGGGNTDITTMPTNTTGSTTGSEGNTRSRSGYQRDNRMPDGIPQGKIGTPDHR